MVRSVRLLILFIVFSFLIVSVSAFNFEDPIYGLERDEPAVVTIFNGTTLNVSHSNSTDFWITNEGHLDNVIDILHNWLSNLVWSLSGHTMDADLNMSGNNITNVGNITSNWFFGKTTTPEGNDDLVNKEYVDTTASSIAFDFFLNNDTSDISAFFNMTATSLDRITSELDSSTLGAGTHEIFNWSTEVGVPQFNVLRSGIYDVHIHLSVSGPGGKPTTITPKLYNISSDGSSRNLLITFETSNVLTTIGTEYDLHGVKLNESMLSPGDRLNLELVADVGGAGGNVVVTIEMEGTTDSHFTLQTSTTAFDDRFVNIDGDTMTGDLQMLGNDINGSGSFNTTGDGGFSNIIVKGDIGAGNAPVTNIFTDGTIFVDDISTGVVDSLNIDYSGSFMTLASGSITDSLGFINISGGNDLFVSDDLFVTDNVEFGGDNLFVNSTNVGIGTIIPKKILHLKQNDPRIFFEDSAGGGRFNVSIGSDSSSFTLRDETNSRNVWEYVASTNSIRFDASPLVNTNTGTTPFFVTRLGSSTQALSMWVDDQTAYIESVQDENEPGNGNMIFRVDDDGTADGFFAFQTKSATEYMRIIDGGNVGIGVTDPDQKLEVAGNVHVQDTIFIDTNTTQWRIKQFSSTDILEMVRVDGNSSTLTIGVIDATKGIIAVAGVGVGEGTSGGAIQLRTAADHDANIDFFQFSASADDLVISRSGGAGFSVPFTIKDTTEIVINQNPVTSEYNWRMESDANTHMFFMDFDNNAIGIGTASPTHTLNVVGDLNVTGTSYLGDLIINADNITVNNIISKDGNISFYNSTGGKKVIIDQGGNVGIGTANPDRLLHLFSSGLAELNIESTSTRSGIQLIGGQAGDVIWQVYSGFPGAGDFAIREDGVASRIVVKKTTGNVGIGVNDADTRLEVFHAGTQLKLSHDATNFITFAVQNDGDLIVDSNKTSYEINFTDANLTTTGLGTFNELTLTAPDQDYKFVDGVSANAIRFQSMTAGTPFIFELAPFDNDGTDNTFFDIYGNTSDKLRIAYSKNNDRFQLVSNTKDLYFNVGGVGQLILSDTDGSSNFSVGDVRISNDMAFLSLGDDLWDFNITFDGFNPIFNTLGPQSFLFMNGSVNSFGRLVAHEYSVASPSLGNYNGDFLSNLKSPNEMLVNGRIDRGTLTGIEKGIEQIKDESNCWDEIKDYCWVIDEDEIMCEKILPEEIKDYEIRYVERCGSKDLNVTNLAGMQMVDRLMISEMLGRIEFLESELCEKDNTYGFCPTL